MTKDMSAKEPSEYQPESSGVSDSWHHDGNPPDNDRLSVFAQIRRVPRYWWIVLSAAFLLTGTTVWIRSLGSIDAALWHPAVDSAKPNWWTEVPVRRTDATLPEISGRIFGVAIQKAGAGHSDRVWIVGSGGLLALTQTEGRCWTFYAYDKTNGEFHPPAPDPCKGRQLEDSSASIRMFRPSITRTVYAASGGQAPASNIHKQSDGTKPNPSMAQQRPPADPTQQQSTPAQRKSSPSQQRSNPAQQQSSPVQPPADLPQQKTDKNPPAAPAPVGSKANAPVDQQLATPQYNQLPEKGTQGTETVKVFPTMLDFGDVSVPAARTSAAAEAAVRVFTITNQTRASVRIGISGINGQGAGEFRLNDSCSSAVKPGDSCEAKIILIPSTPGKKNVAIEVQNDFSKPVTVRVLANVLNAKTQEPAPVGTPAPRSVAPAIAVPQEAPDLVAIDFDGVSSSSAQMVSTGGLEWRMDHDDAGRDNWSMARMLDGVTRTLGGIQWQFVGPTKGSVALETRAVNKLEVVQLTEAKGCTDCFTWKRSSSSSFPAWAAGWSTDEFGDHGAVLHSADAGETWRPLTRGALPRERRAAAAKGHPWRWMPRWYLLIMILSVALAVPVLLPPPQLLPRDSAEAVSGSVEGRLSSDKPLSPGEFDALGITAIALGLSRFLRNEKTLPPLTIAINGEWGSGKSSLMNLLRCDLKSYGMHPVWFNAWHHQKEEHLLAALLQTLRLEAVPPIWNLLGVPFRVKLLFYRLKRRWPALVGVSALLIFLIMLDHRVRIDENTDLFLWVISQVLPSFSGKPSTPVSTIPVQGGLLALITAAGILWKGLTAFGANPASLLASVAKGNKIKDLEEQTSFRQNFAQEFRDFTNALGARRPLTIFIDDLDRCLPANVRDVLEAVNFLVSSGDCFVVLGMDRLQVQRAVGLSFKDVAEEAGGQARFRRNGKSPESSLSEAHLLSPDNTAGAASKSGAPSTGTASSASNQDDKEVSRAQRAIFAQRYLEKLINLEVRVPLAADDKTKQRLFEKGPKVEPAPFKEQVMRYGLIALQGAVPFALAALLMLGGYQLSRTLAAQLEHSIKGSHVAVVSASGSPQISPTPVAKADATPGATTSIPSPVVRAVGGKAAIPGDERGELVMASGIPWKFAPGSEAWPPRWILSVPFYLAGISLLLFANVALTTRPGVVTRDSRKFTDALERVWYPLILANQNTPRAAKRFVNRVRYLAMRQRAFHDQASTWERVLFPNRLREPAGAVDLGAIPEPILVAMAAIEQLEPRLIYDKTAFERLVKGKLEASDFSRADLVDSALLAQARSQHQQDFRSKPSDWDSLQDYRGRFISIWPRTDPTEPV